MIEITKQDWRLFREKIVFWQEAYMERLNREYVNILTSSEDASEKFWKLEKQIRTDKKSPGVIIQLRKQNLPFDLAALITDNVITFSDIEEFSDELKECVRLLCRNVF